MLGWAVELTGWVFFDKDVSHEISEFVREKMRPRLKDQRLIDILMPTDYGFGTHRVPLERNYPEVYHKPNVELVGVRDNPIHRIVPDGIELADGTVRLNILLTYRWLDGVPARTPPGRANSVY